MGGGIMSGVSSDEIDDLLEQIGQLQAENDELRHGTEELERARSQLKDLKKAKKLLVGEVKNLRAKNQALEVATSRRKSMEQAAMLNMASIASPRRERSVSPMPPSKSPRHGTKDGAASKRISFREID